MSTNPTTVPHEIYLSRQGGAEVYYYSDDEKIVYKEGRGVQPHEAAAMELVATHTDVPIPTSFPDGCFFSSNLGVLETVWESLDDSTKERMCNDIWSIVAELRTIPKPPELSHLFQCSADGTPTITEPFLRKLGDVGDLDHPNDPQRLHLDSREPENLKDVIRENFATLGREVEPGGDGSLIIPREELTDYNAVLARLYHRYLHHYGRLHAHDLLPMFPSSSQSVFAHSDLQPRNIMVDEKSLQITGIVDWETAGWYPDYWEYLNIWKPTRDSDDWQKWMEYTAPQKWDRQGFNAARRVLLW